MTQKEAILNHLQEQGSITPLEALNKYHSFRLADIIFKLRNEGHDILTIPEGKQNYARYELRVKQEALL